LRWSGTTFHETVARAISGHKDAGVFRSYLIASPEDIANALGKVRWAIVRT